MLGVVEGAAAAGLGMLALVVALAAFRHPYVLGPLVAVLLPVEVPLKAAVAGGALGYAARLVTRRQELRLRPAHWTFALFVAWVALSTLNPGPDSLQLRDLLFWGALAFVFHAVTTHLEGRRERRLLLAGLAVATLTEASFALFQYVDRWSDRFSRLNGAIVFPLPEGTLDHANVLAQFLVLATFALLALALADSRFVRRAGVLVVGASSLALVVTFSRASWIAFVAAAAVYLLHRRSRTPLLIAGGLGAGASAVLALTGAGAIGARISSLFTAPVSGFADFRLELAERAARSAADHPLIGSGRFEEVGIYAGRLDLALHPHNLFLGLAVFFGIPAAVAFGALVVVAVKASWDGVRNRTGSERLAAVGALAFLVALLVNGLFEYPFFSPSVKTLIVVGLAAVVPRLVSDGNPS